MTFRDVIDHIFFSERCAYEKNFYSLLEKEAGFVRIAKSCTTLEQLNAVQAWWIRILFEKECQVCRGLDLKWALKTMDLYKNRRAYARAFIAGLKEKIEKNESDIY